MFFCGSFQQTANCGADTADRELQSPQLKHINLFCCVSPFSPGLLLLRSSPPPEPPLLPERLRAFAGVRRKSCRSTHNKAWKTDNRRSREHYFGGCSAKMGTVGSAERRLPREEEQQQQQAGQTRSHSLLYELHHRSFFYKPTTRKTETQPRSIHNTASAHD